MGEAPKASTLQSADRSEKRAIILSEAIKLFNDQGYHDTRLEDVAGRLSTAKTSISYHFKSKEALLFEAYSGTCDFAEAEIKLAADAPTGLERVVRWIRAYAQAQSAAILGHRMPLAVISDPSALGEGDARSIKPRLAAHGKALRSFIRKGIEDKSIRSSSPAASAFLLISMQQWIRRWLQNVVPDSHDAAIDALCDLLCYGLAASRSRKVPSARSQTAVDTDNFLFDRKARNKMKLEAFLRIGTRHLNRWGYRNLSVHDVAAELGVTRGVFYYHFDDKDALLNSCVHHTLDMMEKALATHMSGEADAMTRLHLFLTSLYNGHLTDLNPLLRLTLFSALDEKQRPIATARFKRVTAGISELVAHGISGGSIRPVDIEALEYLICGAIFGATRQRLTAFGIEADGEQGMISAPHYFQTLFFGLAAER
ncbi:TetR/AcrR family transcriptional regulator [Parvularcula marina]|uniref:TetR/AcrR family transcriptional regulator n=1 Tax=Parvularcula marina TaxID=2292771 RepID=A0A371RI57_9PROT|nr:TetR/AcrR family transcriptional regulator [Parvularcula marina]RFB05144.1 TetR/AcrR family transcriptional regulator [Parvularcula marina]